MANFSSVNVVRGKSTETSQPVSVASVPRRTLFPLHATSKLTTSTMTTSNICHQTSSGSIDSLECCSTTDTSDDSSAPKGKDLPRQRHSKFTSRHLEQIWAPHNETCSAQIPTSRKAHSAQTDGLRRSCKIPRWSNGRIKSFVADWISPPDSASVNLAAIAASQTTKGDMSEKSRMSESSNEPNELLEFLYKCIDTDSDERISVVDLKEKCAKYAEVATFLGVDHHDKDSKGFGEFLTRGKIGITKEDLCKFMSVWGGIKKTDMSLQTRRKLAYDFIRDNCPSVTLFTIANMCGKHPIFLKFLMAPENVDHEGRVADYFKKVDSAGKGTFSSKQKSIDDFCCFFDQVNGKSGSIDSTGSLNSELMAFIDRKNASDKKVGVGNDAEIKVVLPQENGNVVPSVLSRARRAFTTKTASAKTQVGTASQSQILCHVDAKPVIELGGKPIEHIRPLPRPDIILSAPSSPNSEHSTLQTPTCSHSPSSGVCAERHGKKEVVCFPSGNVLLGRDQKPIWRSDLSFGMNSGILIGPDDTIVFDEDGHPFKKKELCVAVDGKPALDGNHRLIKKLESKKVVRKEIVERKGDDWVTRSEKYFSASDQSRPSEVLQDKTILDVSGGVVLGRDGLPVTRDEVVLSPNGDFLLSSTGHLVLFSELQVGDGGKLLGLDQLPVTDVWQKHKILKADDLLLSREGVPVVSTDGMLVSKTDVMHVGPISIPLRDVTIQNDGTFHGPDGKEILGEDGFVLTKGEVLMGGDDKPLVTSEGKPIMQHDLVFSNTNILCGPGGMIIRDGRGQPLLHKNIYVGKDGRPRLSHDGKVIEMKDVLHNFSGTPLFAAASNEPITRTDLTFSKRDKLVGLGTVICKKDGTPYMRGDVLMNTDGKPSLDKAGHLITEGDVTFSPIGDLLASELLLQVLGSDGKPLGRMDLFLDANERPKFTMKGRLMELKDLVRSFNGNKLCDSQQNPVARSDLALANDGRLITIRGTKVLRSNGVRLAS